MSALRSSPGGFNSARAQSTGHKVEDDTTFRAVFQSTGGFERQQSGNLPNEMHLLNVQGAATTSESQRTLSNSNQGSQQRVIK